MSVRIAPDGLFSLAISAGWRPVELCAKEGSYTFFFMSPCLLQ